jgi:hypothetical protein
VGGDTRGYYTHEIHETEKINTGWGVGRWVLPQWARLMAAVLGSVLAAELEGELVLRWALWSALGSARWLALPSGGDSATLKASALAAVMVLEWEEVLAQAWVEGWVTLSATAMELEWARRLARALAAVLVFGWGGAMAAVMAVEWALRWAREMEVAWEEATAAASASQRAVAWGQGKAGELAAATALMMGPVLVLELELVMATALAPELAQAMV